MLVSLILIVIGILYIIIPHFLLPLGYIQGSGGARLLSECYIWYHPEIYLGGAIVVAGILYLRWKKVLLGIVVLAGLAIVQAVLLRPVSYYTGSELPVVVLAQTYSLRAHMYLKETLLVISAFTVLISTAIYMYNRRKMQHERISLYTLMKANLQMRRFRTVAIVLSLVIVLGALFTDMLLTQSIENALEVGAGRLGADLMVVPEDKQQQARTVLLSGGPTTFYMDRGILEQLKKYPEVEKITFQMYLQPFSYLVCCIVESVLIIAYDPESDFTIGPWIKYSLRRKQGPFDLVVGRGVKFYPGQKITLFGREFKVVASLDPTGVGFFDNSVFIPYSGVSRLLAELKKQAQSEGIQKRKKLRDESFSHLFGSQQGPSLSEIDPEGISAVFIKTKENVSVNDFAEKIKKDIKGVGVIKVKEATVTVKRHLLSMLKTLFLPIILLLAMGTLILTVVFSMSVTERLREIGLLRAMGAKKIHVFNIVLSEALVLTLIGGSLGMLFGTILILTFKNRIMAALNLLYIWPTPAIILTVVGVTLLASVFIGLIAGLYPAMRASRMEPYYAIRAGER